MKKIKSIFEFWKIWKSIKGHGSNVWDAFESIYATTYMIYPVNDGEHPDYKQATSKERVIAYLKAIRDKKEKTTEDYFKEMDEQWEQIKLENR